MEVTVIHQEIDTVLFRADGIVARKRNHLNHLDSEFHTARRAYVFSDETGHLYARLLRQVSHAGEDRRLHLLFDENSLHETATIPEL